MLPNVKLKDFNKKKIVMNTLAKDGPILINFWTMACEPCKKEMKYLNEFNVKYKKYGFNVVRVNTDNSRTFSRVKPYVNSKKYTFDVLSDPKSLFFRKLGGVQCPYSVVVDENGHIINRHIGYSPGDEIKLEKEIVELLESSIRSDSTLADTSIINILNSIDEDSKKEDLEVPSKIESNSEE